ncbi:GH116 family glycosyl-hydrolase [Porticoccus sp. GXU_MW_L64]
MSEQVEGAATSDCCNGGYCGKNGTPEFTQMIPADKALSPEWVKSLYERGEPKTYRGDELKYIGMPVSGICTGQVYLGGDGQLWHWDVFKAYGGSGEIIDPRGYHYKEPVSVKSPMDQGFALKIETADGGSQVRRLDASGFANVGFQGQYPIGRVEYGDADAPVTVVLEAYSPFIPLDENNSGLPATVVEYSVTNTSDKPIEVSLAGWLENKVCRYDDEAGKGIRRNDVSTSGNALLLSCFADQAEGAECPSTLEGYGNMTLALLDSADSDLSCAVIDSAAETVEAQVFEQLEQTAAASASQPFGTKTVGALGRTLELAPGETQTVKFAISWYFPKYSGGYVFHSTMESLPDLEKLRRHYAAQFESSLAVIEYLAENFADLSSKTRLWTDTWYDSSLPHWFLDRIFLNTSTLATQTCHWFDTGRFWAWEGVDCCQGTCQHVWQYAQTISRLFPAFERSLREDIDFGIAFCEDGSIEYRADCNIGGDVDMKSENNADAFFAADGQLGTIIRVYREHSMCADSGFLTRIWPKVKKSMEFMMTLDKNEDGLLDDPQFNTLDTSWHGEIPWISSLFLAGLAACKQMATEMGDSEFAERCNTRLEAGRKNIVEQLYNGEYFVHQPDPSRPEAMNLTEGCYIDQVFGQGYAAQLGLERVIPEAESVSALKSLWKYNYTPDVGPYREKFKEVEGGRWYAMPGEGGLLMCTWPKNDCNRADFEQKILGLDVTSEGYLNECMSGFEYQVASHMMAEGLVEESLAVTRTIHDRYNARERNPWNEVECSDHYSRAMACYGVFLNACGYHYHGPKGELSFAPRLTPENFKAAFTVAEGWGSYSQSASDSSFSAQVELAYGSLELNKVTLRAAANGRDIQASINGSAVACEASAADGTVEIRFAQPVILAEGDTLTIAA